MGYRSTFALAALIAALVAADFLLSGGAATLFLAARFVAMIEYLAFWR